MDHDILNQEILLTSSANRRNSRPVILTQIEPSFNIIMLYTKTVTIYRILTQYSHNCDIEEPSLPTGFESSSYNRVQYFLNIFGTLFLLILKTNM